MLRKAAENEVILRENEIDSRMYKVVSGKMEVYIGYGTDRETIIGILSEGAYFGELGVLTDSASIYTVVAYCDSLILEIKKDEIENYASLNYRDLLSIMTNMAASLIEFKKNIEMLTDDIAHLLEDRENAEKTMELKNRIRNSDITRMMVQYNAQMNRE